MSSKASSSSACSQSGQQEIVFTHLLKFDRLENDLPQTLQKLANIPVFQFVSVLMTASMFEAYVAYGQRNRCLHLSPVWTVA
jgi:hypothetical protein